MASSRASSSSLALAVVPLAALVLLLGAGPGAAQSSSAPAPSSSGSSSGSCLTEIVSLYPCLGYMSGNGSTSSKPSASCCSALSSVVASNPRCLCSVLGGGAASLGVTVNSTRALELPGACNVKTPPPSECKSAGVPVPSTSSPATTPSTTTPASPATASVPVAPSAAGTRTTTKATQTAESSSGSTTSGKATSVFPVAVVVLSAAVALLHA